MNENIVKIIPIIGLPEFRKNDNLIQILDVAFGDIKEKFMENDVLVITQKIISKIEDRAIDLEVNDISEVLKNESTEILRKRGETVIARTKHGFICANA
ncbi:coenzyme F420-0:L-glutamate ligase, partial [Acidimicrobiia bacterium]|nr:coenzyme F420-0:L-glutamate ligase [Acidimicrobiia bacterium]